jgi:hypothetical protein
MMSTLTFFDYAGFTGLALFLWAYAMMNLGIWNQRHMRFHALNLLGAACVMVSLSHNWNLPVFVLECCWGSIAAYGMWNIYRQRKRS